MVDVVQKPVVLACLDHRGALTPVLRPIETRGGDQGYEIRHFDRDRRSLVQAVQGMSARGEQVAVFADRLDGLDKALERLVKTRSLLVLFSAAAYDLRQISTDSPHVGVVVDRRYSPKNDYGRQSNFVLGALDSFFPSQNG